MKELEDLLQQDGSETGEMQSILSNHDKPTKVKHLKSWIYTHMVATITISERDVHLI